MGKGTWQLTNKATTKQTPKTVKKEKFNWSSRDCSSTGTNKKNNKISAGMVVQQPRERGGSTSTSPKCIAHEVYAGCPVEIRMFLNAYTAKASDDEQRVIWTQQRSPEMEWLLLNAKSAELNDDCQSSSASEVDEELDTKPVINKKMYFPMLYDDIKSTTPVNNNRFIGMFTANPTGSKQTAYYSKKKTLYHEYTSLYWGRDSDAGWHMIQKYGLDRILSSEAIQSLNYEKLSDIPLERQSLVSQGRAALVIFKTLLFDDRDPNVLEDAIWARIRAENTSEFQNWPGKLMWKRKEAGALAEIIAASSSTIPVELIENTLASMPGQSARKAEIKYEPIQLVKAKKGQT